MSYDPQPAPDPKSQNSHMAYWRSSLRVVAVILIVWASISLGAGVLLRNLLDASLPKVGGAPFGFWMSQQGAIFGFLILLFVYMIAMNRLDLRYGFKKGAK